MANTEQKIAGGMFLFVDADADSIVTPEDFTEEQRMIAQLTEDFVNNELETRQEEAEMHLDIELCKQLLRAAGEVGLLAAEIPERFEGMDIDKVSVMLINEKIGTNPSFMVSFGGQTGIGSLPIVYFGNEDQKRRYLPGVASGEKLASYALTEPSAGTDALGARTTARLSEDGKYYILNGSKQFISGAGFADFFIVFAKVNGTDFTAFIVDNPSEGLTVGAEEKKMGLKGSSTCALTFEDVKVPVENVLGEIGKGHVIAFNILNIGRLKLAAGTLGLSKLALELSAKYANERKQFGRPISSFPLIGRKLADMAIRTYVLESMLYRTAGALDQGLHGLDNQAPTYGADSAKAIAEYALECSINKVFGSEAVAFATDEGVQIHGGYGFTQEYRIERMYRDCRIFRIFEGTNEINRMLIPDMLMKKSLKGELPAWNAEVPDAADGGDVLAEEAAIIRKAKAVCRGLFADAQTVFGKALGGEQELCAHLADIVIAIFGMESTLLRTRKMIQKNGEAKAAQAARMTTAYVYEAAETIRRLAKEAICRLKKAEERESALATLESSFRIAPVSLIEIKRGIAEQVIQAEKYLV